MFKKRGLPVLAVLLALGVFLAPAPAKRSWLAPFTVISDIVSTVPANGDVNPYGVAVVPKTIGKLVKNAVLVSNFNNGANQQGTGTTIVQILPDGTQTLFAQLVPADLPITPQRVGLTTALAVLKTGWVIVGSLPTTDGTAATATDGNIFILNSSGQVVDSLAGPHIRGPWDMTAVQRGARHAILFVSMVLKDTVAAAGAVVNGGYILRMDLRTPPDTGSNKPTVVSQTVVAEGFPQRTDPAALVIGITGLAFGPGDKLYVADTLVNEIRVITRATKRKTVGAMGKVIHSNGLLNQPLGLMITPKGTLVAANGGDGLMVEISPAGREVFSIDINPGGAGTLFGLARRPGGGVFFVDDGTNMLRALTR